MANKTQRIVLGGGCFWGLEAVFQNIKGVLKTTVGYAGGITKNPTYEEVCTGKTRHAEAVLLEFNPAEIILSEILKIFFDLHDPTTLNRQGNDIGSQYRSVILYHDEDQKSIITNFIERIKNKFDKEITTEIKKLDNFYRAEEYHQNYFNKDPKNAYCQAVIRPKLNKIKKPLF